jgi:hypothetical protein
MTHSNHSVIPAQVGIQGGATSPDVWVLDSRLRGNDVVGWEG